MDPKRIRLRNRSNSLQNENRLTARRDIAWQVLRVSPLPSLGNPLWQVQHGGFFRPELSGLGYSFPDRKSTRLNSSHQIISYAVFCLKKKKNTIAHSTPTFVFFFF